MKLIVNNVELQLPSNIEISIQYTNNFFNIDDILDKQYSIPFNLPASDHNRLALNFPQRIAIQNTMKYAAKLQIGILEYEGTLFVETANNETIDCDMTVGEQNFAIAADGIELKSIDMENISLSAAQVSSLINQDTFSYPTDRWAMFPVYNEFFFIDETPTLEKPVQNYYKNGTFITAWIIDRNIPKHPITPFLFLNYVIERIFLHFNISMKYNEIQNDVELNQLILYSNFDVSDFYTRTSGTTNTLDFNTRSLLPYGIDCIAFISELSKFLNFGIHIKNNQFEIRFRKSIVESKNYNDITHLYSFKTENNKFQKQANGYTISYTSDEQFYLNEDNFIEIELEDVIANVETYSDLASAVSDPRTESIAYVNNVCYFYQYINGVWTEYTTAQTYPEIIGSGEIDIPAEIGTIQETISYTDPDAEIFNNIPALNIEGNGTRIKNKNKLTNSLLMFNTGIVNFKPYGSRKFNNYTLSVKGSNGTYEKFWANYIDWYIGKREVEMILNVDEIFLSNYKPYQKYRINGVNYFIIEMQITFTHSGIKPARCKLWKAEL